MTWQVKFADWHDKVTLTALLDEGWEPFAVQKATAARPFGFVERRKGMTERDIDGLLLALKEAALKTKDDDLIAEAALELLGCFLKDVNRIATALERLEPAIRTPR